MERKLDLIILGVISRKISVVVVVFVATAAAVGLQPENMRACFVFFFFWIAAIPSGS